VVAGLGLPGIAPDLGDAGDRRAAGGGCILASRRRVDRRTLARRDHRPGAVGEDGGMAVEAVVGLVGADRGDRRVHGGEQAFELAAVGSLARGQGMGVQRPGPGVHGQMQLAPDPALVRPVHAHLPLALAMHLEPGGVDGEVQGAAGWPRELRHRERRRPAREGGIVRDLDRQPEQPRQIIEQALGLAQRQPEHRAQAQRAEDRCIAVAPSLAAARPPAGEHRLVDPERDRAARHQSAVVLPPVRDPVTGLRLRGSGFADALGHPKRESLSHRLGNPLCSATSMQQHRIRSMWNAYGMRMESIWVVKRRD
jgi:hypothetical protein